MDFSPVTPRRSSTPRAGRRGCFAALGPLVIVAIVILVLSGLASQCSNSDSGISSGADTTTESGQPYTAAESYALDTLNYTDAASVTASDVVSGVGDAPAPIRSYVASYTAQAANSELNWIAIGDENNSHGYLALRATDGDFEKRLVVLRSTDGKYTLSGPDWTGVLGR